MLSVTNLRQHVVFQLINWPEGGYFISDKPMPRGEIVIGGPNVAVGYFNGDGKSNEAYQVFPVCD